MLKTDTFLTASALVLGGAALAVALGGRAAGETAMPSAVDLEPTRRGIEDLSRAVAASIEGRREVEARLSALERARPPERKVEAPAAGPAAAAPAGAKGGADERSGSVLRAEFRALRTKVFAEEASAEEQQRFWEIVKAPGFLDGLLADQEAAVAKAPGDLDARMDLADDYIAKLFTVQAGPEMGVWGTKAEAQWKEVLRQEEGHWQARFNIAVSWSHYPEILNRTPDAVREFEELRRRQEASSPEARHAATYLHLHLLHRRLGTAAKSREALEEGLRRFPEDPELVKLSESLGK